VEERRLRIGSLFEWLAAAAGVFLLLWLISVPVQRALGPQVEAALIDAPNTVPAGIPGNAVGEPLILLLDGREIRRGDLMSHAQTLLPEQSAEGQPLVSTGELGERITRAYHVDGTQFYVVYERLEPGGPMKVAGVYLP
jgi:hypothetical protein